MKEKKKRIILLLVTVLVILIYFSPIYWAVITSLKTDAEFFSSEITYFPKTLYFGAWAEQFRSSEFLLSLRNSVVIALGSMLVSIVLGVPAAYAMGRYNIPGANIILLFFLVTQMLPVSVLLTPLYLIYSKMGLLNSFLGPVLANATHSIPFIIVTLRPYFISVPKALDEAAKLDGCGPIKSFLLVMLPTIKTGVITVMAISFLHGWNDLVFSMTFNVNADMRPLTANIYKFLDMYGAKWNSIMAYGLILVIPVVAIFVFLQRYLVEGLTSGAVKE